MVQDSSTRRYVDLLNRAQDLRRALKMRRIASAAHRPEGSAVVRRSFRSSVNSLSDLRSSTSDLIDIHTLPSFVAALR